MRRIDVAVLALGMLASSACERPGTGAGGPPSRVPGSADPALSVPYPVTDPERIEGAGRAMLANARFVFIGLGSPDPEIDHSLPERISVEGPVLFAHHLEPDQRGWPALNRLAFGRVEPTRGEPVEVDPAELEELDLRPPADAVWLVGPRGTCRASVGRPFVGAYETLEALVVGYRLEECPGSSWAQVGIVSNTMPVDLRWVPAEAPEELVVSYGTVVDEPLAPLLPPPRWSDDEPPSFELLQLRGIPDAEPRVVQARRAWLTAVPEPEDPAWCEARTAWTRVDGWYNGRWLDPIPWTADAIDPFMLGAFVNGTQVDAVIYDDRLDGLVVVPPGPLDDVDDPDAWTQVFVPTGPYERARLDAWGVQPARGPLPIGRPCEPGVAASDD